MKRSSLNGKPIPISSQQSHTIVHAKNSVQKSEICIPYSVHDSYLMKYKEKSITEQGGWENPRTGMLCKRTTAILPHYTYVGWKIENWIRRSWLELDTKGKLFNYSKRFETGCSATFELVVWHTECTSQME